MLASAAVHSAVSSMGVSGACIKWPNDILVGNRKLAGIVVFARHGDSTWVSVGLGLNIEATPVLGEDHPLQATSLDDETADGGNGNRDDVLVRFITNLSTSLKDPGPALEVWRRELVQKPGDTVSLRMASGKNLTGSLLEVTEEGFLRLDVDGEERTITGGDIIEG
jgi:BirA family biotin operon repressor/biotin-[acetyl-CoA-carboxylase] ligase